VYCNILEDVLGPAAMAGGGIEISYTPYKIVSLKLT
jgi:hypothetical protein